MKSSFRISLLAVCCAAMTACASETPGQQVGGPGEGPGPTLTEASVELTAALTVLERVLHESIPAEEWEQARGGYQTGCSTAGQGRFVAPQFIATARPLPEAAWPRIEQALDEHGFRSEPAVPLRGGSGSLVRFTNGAGDEIAVSSIQPGAGHEGGSGFRGETACHGGY